MESVREMVHTHTDTHRHTDTQTHTNTLSLSLSLSLPPSLSLSLYSLGLNGWYTSRGVDVWIDVDAWNHRAIICPTSFEQG